MSAVADLNFGDLIEAVATVDPARLAVIYGGSTLSWGELDERSNRLARRLGELGLTPGSKVAFYLRNSPAYVELLVACFKGRFTHANVNYRYVDHELHHVIDNSDAEVVVFDADFGDHVDVLRPRLDKVQAFLEVGGTKDSSFAIDFETACCEGDASPLGIERSGDDLYFMYTGGTTGYPKAVMWPHKARIAVLEMTDAPDAASHAAKVAASEATPVTLPACPMMHSTGFSTALGTLLAGGTVVLMPTRNFEPASCLETIERHGVTRVAIVGDAFSVPILDHLRAAGSRYRLDHVKGITSAGAMWSERCKLELLEYFPNAVLSDSLGSSEGSRLGASEVQRGGETTTAAFRVGPLVKIFTEDFREVEPGSGEAGMIAKAGPLPLGYYGDPEGTARAFPTIDGVRYSMAGDWCRIEADGSMTLLGRGNNCINTGGEKVYPEEVEEVLKSMPAIIDVAVLGVPDDRWGQAVAALVRVREGETSNESLDRSDMASHLNEHLARYKHPRRTVETRQNFRHANGKINYRLARRMLEVAESAEEN